MNKELVTILYSIRCSAIQSNLCRPIGFLNTTSQLCINKLDCSNCILNMKHNSKFYPNRIAITSLNLFQEAMYE